MKTIPKAILGLLASEAIEAALVPILDFTLSDASHLRYVRYTSDFTYDGDLYTAWPFSAQLMGRGKGGTVPTFTLTIADAVRTLRPSAIATQWFRDCTLTIAVVCVDYLALDYAWSTVTYDILHAKPAREDVVLKLGGPNPVKMRFPSDRYWADQCPYARGFKDDPRCGYSGGETTCDGTLESCSDKGNAARFGGFLGLDPDGAKLVVPASLKGIL